MKYVGAAEFKAKCLKLMDEVQASGEPITITKRGKAVVVMNPPAADAPPRPLFGMMRGTMKITGDIVSSPLDPDWEREWEAKWDARGFTVKPDAQ